MRWEHIHWLWALALPVGMMGSFLLSALLRRRARNTVRWPGIPRVVAGRSGLRPARPGRESRRPWMLTLALAGIIIALARPQWGQIEKPVRENAREVMIALDLSRSMLVEDVPPNRIYRARLLTKSLLEGLDGERVGLIVFAGTAFVQVPLSADYEILEEFLPELKPGYLPQGGTDYAGMLRAALGGFSQAADTDRFLIVLSDGEALDEGWRDQLPALKERNVRVIALGVGTPSGGFIPDPESNAYVKDARGAVVLSRLEPATLQALAHETGGAYRDASLWVDLPALLAETIARGRRGEFTELQHIDYIERFQWFLGPAILLALIGLFREIPVRPRARNLGPGAPAPQPPAPAKPAAGRNAAGTLALLVLLFGAAPDGADALERDEPPPASSADQLRDLVARLADAPAPTASDWRELAEKTLAWATDLRNAGQPPPEGPILDALAAIEAGRRLDPDAADWDRLRQELETFLQKPPEPPQQNPNQQQQQQDASDQEQQQQQNADSQQSEGEGSGTDEPQSRDNASGRNGENPNAQDSDASPQSQDNPPAGEQDRQNADNPQNQDSGGNDRPPESQPRPRGEQLGDLADPGEPNPAGQDRPEPSRHQPRQNQPQRTFGGRPAEKHDGQPMDAETAAMLRKLMEAREGDSPARLFQLLEDDSDQPAKPEKDW